MSKKRSNEEIEQLLFDEFSKLCPLTFTHRESRPEPEPDILATLDTGDLVAFELTQVDDSKMLEQESNEFELTQQLQSMDSLLKDIDELTGFSFHVYFYNQTFGQQKKLLPQVIDAINENRPPKSTQGIRVKNKLVCKIVAVQHNFAIPVQLGVGTGTNVGDYTLERINKKIHVKNYETPHPIHLLAWGTSVWPAEKWQAEVLRVANQQSKFERIWVFSYGREFLLDCSNPEWKPAI